MTGAEPIRPPVRVVHVVLQLAVGGMEKLLVEFARHGDRQRFRPHIIALGGKGGPAEEIAACGWPVVALEEPPGLRPGLVLRLAHLFRRWRADIVHSHNTKPLLYAAPAACLTRVPAVIHTRHGQRYQAGRRATALFRLATRFADRIVCVSGDSAQLSVAEGLCVRKLCTIRNAIDVQRFAYTGPDPSGPVVLVARLSPEKDVATLLAAAARVRRTDSSFRLEIAGAGACLSALRQQAAELGLGSSVTFLGEIRDVPALLARASAFVLPSLTEGISLTLLEAMARGLPVVATRVGGTPEVVCDGTTGLLVPPRAPDALAAALLRLRADPAAGREMGRAARHRVEQSFDVRRMVAAYETLYEEVLGRGRGSTGKSSAGVSRGEAGKPCPAPLALALAGWEGATEAEPRPCPGEK